ncbi:hypothetical protein PR048_027833 [Dryococelus australis]|uniref:Tesmin/TSO1-like CXC domain-containing protein n=1 Tax=Dryococelus australis TaxID=614101 RepID=A0ABQ9GHN6_9NEOP|nr:hypothetical protein PR048_027833 [Dryococelus australis]
MLIDKLAAQCFHVKHAVEDADPFIVSAEIYLAEQGRTAVILGKTFIDPDATPDQVQVWKNNFLIPQQWGWKTTKHGLLPNAIEQPQELLNKIVCTRRKGCRAACSCRKSGIKCLVICTQCKGHTCTNSPSEDEGLQVDVTSYEKEVSITEDRLSFDPFLDEELHANTEMVQLEDLEEDTSSPSSSKLIKKQ